MSNGNTESPKTKAAPATIGAPSVTFASKSPNFTIYLESPKPVPGIAGSIEYKGGIAVRFINHRYVTSDTAIIAKMRKARSFGTQFQEVPATRTSTAPEPAAA